MPQIKLIAPAEHEAISVLGFIWLELAAVQRQIAHQCNDEHWPSLFEIIPKLSPCPSSVTEPALGRRSSRSSLGSVNVASLNNLPILHPSLDYLLDFQSLLMTFPQSFNLPRQSRNKLSLCLITLDQTTDILSCSCLSADQNQTAVYPLPLGTLKSLL